MIPAEGVNWLNTRVKKVVSNRRQSCSMLLTAAANCCSATRPGEKEEEARTGLDLISATADNSIAGSFPVSVLPDLPSHCHRKETESSRCHKSVVARFKLNQSPSKGL